MKKLFVILLSACLFLCFSKTSYSQFNKLRQKIKDKVNQRVDNKEDKAIDKTLDNAENSAKKNGDSSSASQNDDKTNKSETVPSGPATLRTYRNYDFIPGDKIIFQSQLADESVGEIPSQFVLDHGQMDIQVEDGENVIHVLKGAGATMTPRMKNTSYMPDQFTIELDFKNETFGLDHLMVDFGHRTYYASVAGELPGIRFDNGSVNWTLGDFEFSDALKSQTRQPMQWHHIAIAINKNVGKIYVDQYRVGSVNNLTGKANNVTIDVNGYENSFIKNIRIAAGGIDIYKQVTTDNKIILHGILFDVDKATIKPESMGTINSVYSTLQKDPSLKFEIDGHTDNSGTAPHNLTLSQDRADAVKAQLVSMGIDASRLTTKGFGDTKPLGSNDSPEGKANNRRVELIKI